MKLSKEERSWVLYDCGNSAYFFVLSAIGYHTAVYHRSFGISYVAEDNYEQCGMI